MFLHLSLISRFMRSVSPCRTKGTRAILRAYLTVIGWNHKLMCMLSVRLRLFCGRPAPRLAESVAHFLFVAREQRPPRSAPQVGDLYPGTLREQDWTRVAGRPAPGNPDWQEKGVFSLTTTTDPCTRPAALQPFLFSFCHTLSPSSISLPPDIFPAGAPWAMTRPSPNRAGSRNPTSARRPTSIRGIMVRPPWRRLYDLAGGMLT